MLLCTFEGTIFGRPHGINTRTCKNIWTKSGSFCNFNAPLLLHQWVGGSFIPATLQVIFGIKISEEKYSVVEWLVKYSKTREIFSRRF